MVDRSAEAFVAFFERAVVTAKPRTAQLYTGRM